MIDGALREFKEKLLFPVACKTGKYIRPTTITLISGVFGIGASVLAAGQFYHAGLAFWIVNRVLDGLDGTVARVHHRQSDLGAYIDIVTDFVTYAAIPVGLVLGRPDRLTMIALLLLFGVFYVNTISWSYLSALLERRAQGATTRAEKTSVTMPKGLIEGTETIFFYTLFFVFPDSLGVLFFIMAILTVISASQRIVWAVHNLT